METELVHSGSMTEKPKKRSRPLPATGRILPLLLVLFVGSGCAALIYEIVWFQLLQLIFGSSAVSLGVLLGTFMGGMCLGSMCLPRLVSPRLHPLFVYAVLELLLGIIGLALQFVIPNVDRLYSEAVGGALSGIMLRGIVCAVCLLPPTVLMGATLPAIARWVESTPRGVSWLGFFYGGNIVGAVVGCLLAGFYLLRVHDMATATYVAAAVNGSVALLGFLVALGAPYNPAEKHPPERWTPAAGGAWLVYVAIALSGASALGAEVIWTRLLSLMLGATVYTFSIILAVFLIGLGIGSSVGSFVARGTRYPIVMLACCQLLLAGAIVWTALMLACSLPYWPINPFLSRSPWLTFQLDLARCMWAILPATILWGASFPLALAAAAGGGRDPGRLVGGMYAANTLGAIVGALASSLLVIPWLGTQGGQQILIALSGGASLLLLFPFCWLFLQTALPRVLVRQGAEVEGGGAPTPDRAGKGLAVQVGATLLLTAVIAASVVFLISSVPPLPWELVAFGRAILKYEGAWKKLYVGEGLNSSVAVTEYEGNVRSFHVSGKIEASSDSRDMRVQRMLGHLPALLHPKPRSVLVVGCGAGVTAGSFLTYPDVEKIVICEIEPLVPKAVAPKFAEENYGVVDDPRVEIVYDDARHYILTTPHTFDIITSDPIHPWVKGSATLYTQEYFELCRRRLNPGGLITQWVPLYESSAGVVKSEIATFFEVFPHGTIWSNDQGGWGYDLVMLGQQEPLRVDPDELQRRLSQPDHAAALRSLEHVGFQTVIGLFASYAGQARDLRPWLEDAQINRDRNLRLQYLAGMELNNNQGEAIYREMASYRRFPDEIFTGTGLYSQMLRVALEQSIAVFQSAPRE